MFAKKRKWMSRHSTPSASYLDFGCGTGDFVNSLAEEDGSAMELNPTKKQGHLIQHTKMYMLH